MLDQDNNFYLIQSSTLTTCLLDNGWILLGEVACESLLRVKGLIRNNCQHLGKLLNEVQKKEKHLFSLAELSPHFDLFLLVIY